MFEFGKYLPEVKEFGSILSLFQTKYYILPTLNTAIINVLLRCMWKYTVSENESGDLCVDNKMHDGKFLSYFSEKGENCYYSLNSHTEIQKTQKSPPSVLLDPWYKDQCF